MELFKVTCVTCRARLSVRDPALVGQIIGCPRCGMMVEIIAPATPGGGAAPVRGAGAVAAVAVARDGVAAGPPSATAATGATSTTTFDEAAALIESPSAAATIAAEAAATPLAPPGWGAYRIATMLVAGAIAGSAVVAAALSWFTDDEPAAQVAAASTTAAAPAEVAVSAPNDSTPAEAATEPLPDPPATPPEPDAAVVASPPVDSPAEDAAPSEPPAATTTPAKAEDAPPASPPPPPAADAAPSEPPPAEVAARETQPGDAPRLRIDPLDVDPEGLNLSTLTSGPPRDPLAESQLPAEAEPAPSAASDPSDDAPPPADAQRPVRRDEQAGVGAPTSADALLKRRLPSMKVEKMPLCGLIDVAVQVSGLPVSAPPAELRMAAVDASTAASVEANDATIEEVLAKALKPLRLKPVVAGEQIVLQRDAEDKRRTVHYAVDDLASDPAKIEQLAKWIQQFAAPEAWSAAGGDATLAVEGSKLRIEASESVQFEVLLLLERWRVTCGLPTRTKYPAALVASGAFHAAVAERLARPAVFNFSHYTSLREVFRYWQDELAVSVLVDWPALAEERLWPETRIACSGHDRSWAEAMDAVLEPLGAGWRAAGRNTIEITSLTRIHQETMLELYRVKSGVDAANLVSRVQKLLAEESDGPRGVAYDAESQLLLVLESAVTHRRLVAEMAETLNLSAAK